MKFRYLSYLAFLLLVISCNTEKQNINYLRNIEETALSASQQNSVLTIQPGDELMILVTAKDMDVVGPFNRNYVSGEMTQFSLANTNHTDQTQTSAGPRYIVDSKGNIDFPVVGDVNTTGKTVEMLRDDLRERISKYVKNPSINIRNNNFKITVLGEVNKPGLYIIPDGQPTSLFSALGMAGDLTIYGERQNVLLIRNTNGETQKQYIDLTDASLINSPYYYMQQNDVLYITPNKTKKNSSSFGPQTAVLISVASVAVGLLAIIFR